MHPAVAVLEVWADIMRSWRVGSWPLFLQLEAERQRAIPTMSNIRRVRCISREFYPKVVTQSARLGP